MEVDGGGTTRQSTHGKTMSAQTAVSAGSPSNALRPLPALCGDGSPITQPCVASESRREVWEEPSQRLTVAPSPLSHLSTRSAGTQREREGG